MENAWLDSLSEDWISQPRSSGSLVGTPPSLPHSSPASGSCNGLGTSSRIPLHASRKQCASKSGDNTNLPLSERTLNDNNIPLSQRISGYASKPRKEHSISNGARGRQLSRTVSGSTVGSLQRHTIHHKSISLSPQKLREPEETPEWKRRLLLGDVAYGEQRDLFSPAGLENIFRPPPAAQLSSSKPPTRFQPEEIAMPSSPPPYPTRNKSHLPEELLTQVNQQTSVARGARNLNYKMVDADIAQFSEADLSRNSSFHPLFSLSQIAAQESQSNALLENFSRHQADKFSQVGRAEVNRVISGQSDGRHEDLSPIFISRHNMIDGRVDYAALGLPAAQIQHHYQDFSLNGLQKSDEVSLGKPRRMSDNEITNEEMTQIGNYVSIGRGGYSEDGSFQQRMLSPSSLPPGDESAILRDESIQASTPKDTVDAKKKSFHENSGRPVSQIALLEAQHMIRDNAGQEFHSELRPRSGSPLKLFGTYDTFTNQKLLRRLSQFENSLPEDSSQTNGLEGITEGEVRSGSTNNQEVNEAYIAPSSPVERSNRYREPSQMLVSRPSNGFGSGNLDKFEFSEESLESSHAIPEGFQQYSDEAAEKAPDTSQHFSFQLQPSPALENEMATRRHTRRIATKRKERLTTMTRLISRVSVGSGLSSPMSESLQPEIINTPRKRNGDNEGKRLLHSPPKNSTPKRRRTLHKSDIAHDGEARFTELAKESHEHIQSVVGKKRKDARHGDHQEAANPQVMALRQILRPRTPTPSQRSSQGNDIESTAGLAGISGQRARLEQQDKIAKVQAELDATVPLRAPTAKLAGQAMNDDSRKGSVTTQDFLDEAKKIMAGIRGKARPSTGLVSVEESESGNDKHIFADKEPDQDESYQESTKEPFSRPPSREGGPVQRLPLQQQDPEVLNHLKKYEEMSDLDGLIASSLKSIRRAKDAVNAVKNIDRLTDETINRVSAQGTNLDGVYASDPPNIHITEYPELQRKRKHSTSSVPVSAEDQQEADFLSHSSNNSSGVSTGRSVPTGSSRGSDSKHVIAPHTVSHLIPEQLAGMVFDREKHIWIRRREVNGNKVEDVVHCEDTDEDPFNDIPDLTVDETQELHRINAAASKQREEARISEVQSCQAYQKDAGQSDSTRPAHGEPIPERGNLEGAESLETSEVTRLISGATAQATRLTSWSGKYAGDDPRYRSGANENDVSSLPKGGEALEEVEHEISIHESRIDQGIMNVRRRNVTISFSSPLASIIPPEELGHDMERESENELDDNFTATHNAWHNAHAAQTRPSQRATSRQVSFGGCAFVARPVSRIDEREEESFLEQVELDRFRRSVSVVIATPLPGRGSAEHAAMAPSSGPGQFSEGILQLTPLPDFTLNQPDESFNLELSYINYQSAQQSIAGKRTLSLSVGDLVQRITDVEPYEPFWEHIRQIELRGKKLQTLHMLSRFCSRLEELDVSDNEIGQLDGIPSTTRDLRIARNCLSDLSSWGHLTNLQYIDMSNNNITSLEGFQSLVHLRSLRADGNKIRSLNGVSHMDGLLSLRLRDNALQTLDFRGSSLQRLTELDLKGNCILEVHNLQDLRSLTTLNLEDNNLCSLEAEDGDIFWALKYLRLGGNCLQQLNVGQYPNLRLLYLDRNRLGKITGLSKVKHLDSLSLREQQEGSRIDTAFLDEAFEVRKLFLSGNLLTTFAPSVDFLNLQYLELANCGLEALPMDFGQMIANVRVLNLNFNAINDLKPLLGIVRLKRLHLVGNRLSRLRRTTNITLQFPSLTKVDMRNNPLTLGFYPPLSEKRIVIHQETSGEPEELLLDPFTLQDADRTKDSAYANRLDMETRMRRRVFEMLVLRGCFKVKMLDGLVIERTQLEVRDNVWEELVRAGVLLDGVNEAIKVESGPQALKCPMDGKQETESVVKGNVGADIHPQTDNQWPAEDSFA